MPAKSKAQQRFFGVVKGIQQGTGKGGGKAGKAAIDMDPSDVDDFAATKHAGLPDRVKKKAKQETKVRSLIKKMVREIMSEMKEGGPGSGPQSDDDNPFDREPSDDELKDIEKEFESVEEGFAGALKKEDREKFDNMRRKQSEVLGYTLTGTNDIKAEIDDATIKEEVGRIKLKITKSRLKEIIREEILKEDSLGDKFQKTIKRYQDRVRKEKDAYRKARDVQKKHKKAMKSEDSYTGLKRSSSPATRGGDNYYTDPMKQAKLDRYKKKTAMMDKKNKKNENLEKVAIPGNIKRFMGRFIDAIKDGKLNRMKQKSILYKVVKALGISPQELQQYMQKVKRGL